MCWRIRDIFSICRFAATVWYSVFCCLLCFSNAYLWVIITVCLKMTTYGCFHDRFHSCVCFFPPETDAVDSDSSVVSYIVISLDYIN